MDPFWSDCEDIGVEIEHLASIVNDLTNNHQNPKSDKEWQTVEEMLAEVKRLANRIRGKLKRMDVQLKQNAEEDSPEHRIMRTQHLTLSRSFIDVMKAFNERQQAYRFSMFLVNHLLYKKHHDKRKLSKKFSIV